MHLFQVAALERRVAARQLHRSLKGMDVRRHALSGDVVGPREGGLGEASMGEDQPLDPRGGDRLGAEELAGKGLEAAGLRGLSFSSAGGFGVGAGGGDLGIEQESLVGDRGRDVGLEGEATARVPRCPGRAALGATDGRRGSASAGGVP